jgi:hypothetical protein
MQQVGFSHWTPLERRRMYVGIVENRKGMLLWRGKSEEYFKRLTWMMLSG